MLSDNKIRGLKIFSETIRLETVKVFGHLGFGHVGGAMSIIETLATLYGGVMNIDPQKPDWVERDWLVMSKGHAGPALYATLALKGYFPLEELYTLNQPKTNLPSHCDRNKTVGVDMTTGSLGQGMSTAIGVTLGNRLDKRYSYTYLILGDGECDEGQVWEGALFAAHFKLDHLIMFVDFNKQQLDGYTRDIMNLGDLAAKFKEFGWHTQDIDGSDIGEIDEAIRKAKDVKGVPHMIVLNTIKGKGCTFAEGLVFNHHVTVSKEQAAQAVASIEENLERISNRW